MKISTQADVARLAGVSRATVSYVLSRRKNGPISVTEETRQRILKAAEQLGYVPNAAAQSLRLSESKTIGFTIPDMNNPHGWEIINGAESEARRAGYNLLLFSTLMEIEHERTSIAAISRRQIDGLIFHPIHHALLQDEINLIMRTGRPVVILGQHAIPELDTIIGGYDEGARLVMDHLLALGHRRIGYIHGVAYKGLGKERLEAYRNCLLQAGIPVAEENIVYTGINISDGYLAANELLNHRPRPTALLVINDLLAIGAMHAVIDHGLEIPKDISIAGFDDIDIARFLNPSLTTLRVNAREIGITAVRLVLDRLADPERTSVLVTVPYQFIQRASTGPAPINPKEVK
jgi:DNA-binding LacI/PurR family transcriptional regulator